MILANGCNMTKSEKCKGVWILSVPTIYIYIYMYVCMCVCQNIFILKMWEPPSCILKERKGHDMWPSMVTHTRNLCSAFNPSKCTHTHSSEKWTHTHTHTLWTHTRSSGQSVLRLPGSSWRFGEMQMFVLIWTDTLTTIHSNKIYITPNICLGVNRLFTEGDISSHI